ncbi:hypothetical protein [Paenibacillus agricola]|uniref:Uncharacterized protein n=1 Tax=Paenibacillus agricola TaxID=2716264 RepID=A0ABX0JGM3_9BACL|nr:hypothetical protein [Paenibacillus agricola]NHN34399.1 hypothetical protein [Paenibacillus agricola]
MNFQSKVQSINNYLNKLYNKLIKDGTTINDWSTLGKSYGLEPNKLAIYALAIKEEIISELNELPTFKNLAEAERRHLLTLIDQIHQMLIIPKFTITKEECMEEVMVEVGHVNRSVRPSKTTMPYLNMGTPTGAVLGLGLGLLITKSVPVLLIGSIGVAVAGSVIRKSINSSRTNTPAVRTMRQTQTPKRMQTRVSQQKVEAVILRRKAVIVTLFRKYIKQMEEACGPTLT